SRTDLAMSSRVRGGRAHADARSNIVIVGQVALGLIVLTAATILSGEYLKIRYLDLGYEPLDLYTTAVTAPRDQRTDGMVGWKGIAEATRAQLAAIPGVQSASIENVSAVSPQIVRPAESEVYRVTNTPPVKAVDPEYFRTWGTRLVEGRYFTNEDRLGDLPVVIVTDDAATAFWPHGRAIGRRVFVGDSGSVGELLTVVGVVATAERGQLIARNVPILYRPIAQAKLNAPGITFALRVPSGVPAVLASAETELRKVAGRRVTVFRSELDRVRQRFVAQRFNAIALNIFGAFGLLLAAMGVYASVAYSVALRLNEVALRVAFGAEPGSVLRLFARNSIVVVTKGVVLGILGGSAVAKLLPTSTGDSAPSAHALAYAVSAAVMILVTTLATYVPARRAVTVDPVDILRGD
ncbi:MAG TPA: ABC transporter permease, partial [Gemmatimonadaceae bacterium]